MRPPIDSRRLQQFCVLARTGSFTQTARELHLTQSGISHSMKTLAVECEPQLEFHPLFADELHFLVGARHPWAKTRRVERADIPRQNHILYSKRSVTFRLVEEYFRQEKMVLNTVIELGSVEAIKELVKLGLGVSILAPWVARREIEAGSMVALPLGRRKLTRRWGILHWRGKRLNLAEETFVGLCESTTERLNQKPPGR